MKITIAVCVHNEGEYVPILLDELMSLISNKTDRTFELMILNDDSTDERVLRAIDKWYSKIGFYTANHSLNGDFATHKNFMTMCCHGDWILNLDADEKLPLDIVFNLPLIIESNPDVEAYWFPRINTVDGLTLQHVQKWQWILTKLDKYITIKEINPTSEEYHLLKAYDYIISEENGFVRYYQPIICWPDRQMRLYKKIPTIRWEGKVHERLVGFQNFTDFPIHPDFAIQHHKNILRQETQNNFYETINR